MAIPKEFRFAGSVLGEPWWVIADVTRRVLKEKGIDVTIENRPGADGSSPGTESPRWVGRGEAKLGCIVASNLRWTQERLYHYENDDFPEFRGICNITRPSWLGVAVTAESGIKSLRDIAEQQMPARILLGAMTSAGSNMPKRVLAHYGITKEKLESWGGCFLPATSHPYSGHVRENNVDVIMGNIYNGYTPMTRYWIEGSVLLNLKFLELEDSLFDELTQEPGREIAVIPKDYCRGLNEGVRALFMRDILIYTRADLDDDLAYFMAKSYDENRLAFLGAAVPMTFDPKTGACETPDPFPLHPGAEKYYREQGYVK